MKAPVIFLTFANDPDEHLELLKKERKSISRTLRPLDDKQQVKLITESGTTAADIYEIFQEYRGQVAIFHYAGHASGSQLRLEDEGAGSEGADAAGLAEFLGQQESLQLVFLNGCATEPQVDLLLESGVKAVIATSTKIPDGKAKEFSEQFYRELSVHSDIKRAFEAAASFIQVKYKAKPKVRTYRGSLSDSWGAEPEEEDVLPWSLFVAEDANDVLKWKIPEDSQTDKVLRGRVSYEVKPDVNDLLIETICEDLALYSKKLDAELSQDDLDVQAIIREIVDCFPLPIGEQLRKLFTISDDPNDPDEMELFTTTRLKQMYHTYRSTLQFLSYILLSQLWDEKHKDPSLEIDEDHIGMVNSFFAIIEDTYESYSYISLIRAVTDTFDNHNIPYFLEELKQLKINLSDNDPLHVAHTFMESLKSNLDRNSISESELEDICLRAEEELGIVLRAVAFLAKYKLATIKNIELVKRRHEEAQFRHIHIVLRRAITGRNTKTVEDNQVFRNFTDNKSVLFLKTNQDEILGYLSLSPFIVDVNALDNQYSSKLYLFAYENDGVYYYQFMNDPEDKKLEVDAHRYRRVNNEIEKFKANIHGKQYDAGIQKKVVKKSRFSRKRTNN